MRVYGCQFDLTWENPATNLAKAREVLLANRPQPGALVVLPELFATGFTMNVEGLAEPPEGPTEQGLAALAQEFQITLLGGVLGRGPGGRARNLCVGFSPAGREVVRYAKMQPFTPGGESQHYEAGEAPVLFPWEGFSVAPFICYDLRFPEIFRAAVVRGAQVFAVMANWPVTRIEHWTALLRARAIENQAYVVGVNRCGTDPKLTYNGRSLIVGPSGDVLAHAGEGQVVIQADVDLTTLMEYRKALPFLEDMRARRSSDSCGV
jgi:omega-amidase